MSLPIEQVRSPLIEACGAHRRLIIRAPTGSGKSTQIPQMLLDEGLAPHGQIVVLQPRRLATRLLAHRVAHERGVTPGDEVGYQVRFENISSPRTRIKFETEGILLRHMMSDPDLTHVNAILLDEFHERHLYGDVILARAMELQKTRRPDLLIAVMSATLDTGPLIDFMDPCAVLASEGRTFPVDMHYVDQPVREPHYSAMDAAAEQAESLLRQGVEGDMLIFMPGAYEIRRTLDQLNNMPLASQCVLLPLHGELPPRDQDAAVEKYGKRKIVVTTNVAETSLTIDGVRNVIDSGLARIPRFDPYRGINTLLVEKISRASADQRAGRAGRTAPGRCVRLWTEQEHRERIVHELPEIKRLDLSEALLGLKAAGPFDPSSFQWFEAPEDRSLTRALTLLTDLGALHPRTGEVTPLGKRMAAFPTHPRYARMLLAADTYGCVRQAALIAALTQGRPILERRTNKDTREKRDDLLGDQVASDFIVMMRAWHYAGKQNFSVGACRRLGVHAQAARQVRPVYELFLRVAEQQELHINERAPEDEAICRCVLAGFADQVAIRRDSGTLRCRLVHDRKGELARESAVHQAELFVSAEIHEIQSGADMHVLLTMVSRIEESWLAELFPDAMRETVACHYDPSAKRVIAEQTRCYHDLVLESKPVDTVPEDEAASILANEVLRGRLELRKWDKQVEQWIHRVNQLAESCPELDFPIIDAAARRLILEQLCLSHKSYKAIRDQPVWPFVKSMLSHEQLISLDRLMPERLDIGGKRPFRLEYVDSGPPILAARIQELFEVRKLPELALGRIKPVFHILAPNQRPVQITQDLPGFWRDHYPRIRQELKRKYPKHDWRELKDFA